MTWEAALLLVVGLLVGLLLMGCWIAFGLGLAGVIVLVLSAGAGGLAPLASISWNTTASFVLTSVPLFILMGEVILQSQLSDRFYRSVSLWTGGLNGGLLHANIVACGIFAAVCGSSVATAAAIGTVAIPELLKRGYERRILFGSLAAGGTLGILIPPSVPMIIYAAMVEQSVERLFIAGIIPGIALMLLFMAYIWGRATITPHLVPPEREAVGWRQRWQSLAGVAPMGTLILLVMGSIWLGFATPTEAAAVGATAAVVLSALSGRLSWALMRSTLTNTVKTTCMVLFIVLGAQILSYAFVKTGVSRGLSEAVVALGLSRWTLFAILVLLYIFLGCIIDGISMMLLTLPIVYPIVIAAGFDPIWFGIILVILIELGSITPPVGLNMFVLHGLSRGSAISEIVWGSLPFGILMIVEIVLLSFFPGIVTWLPARVVGR